MRITKVNVEGKPVVMVRDEALGYLQHQSDAKDLQQIHELLDKKQANFISSVLNKTFVKESCFKKKKGKNNEEENEEIKKKRETLCQLKKLFEDFLNNKDDNDIKFNSWDHKQLTNEQLSEFLAHKFTQEQPITYNNKSQEFKLADLLVNAFQKAEILDVRQNLKPYFDWADEFIKNKKKHIAQSILNNRIATKHDKPKRQICLDVWAKELVTHHKITTVTTDRLADCFKLGDLITKWQTLYDACEKLTQNDIDEANNKEAERAEKNKQPAKDLKLEIGFPKDFFDFKSQLKRTLSTHQHSLFQANIFSDSQVEQFSLEVTKYIALYFPLKKSGKKLNNEDINYYLLNNDMIKRRIQQQIKNSVIQFLIQKGKYHHYHLMDDGKLSSEVLQSIKIQEAFALQFIDAIAFAANNLRNCVDIEIKNDVLGSNDIKESINNNLNDAVKRNAASFKLSQFFFNQYYDEEQQEVCTDHEIFNRKLSDDSDYIDVFMATRGAIQRIRNEVIHFKQDSISTILKLEHYETYTKSNEKTHNKAFDDNHILKEFFENEIKQLPRCFAGKLRSARVLDYYGINDIKKLLSQIKLNHKPLAFVPGFKKVFNWGKKIQQDKESLLELNVFFEKKQIISERKIINKPEDEARYNALAMVYEQHFIDDFFNNITVFSDAVDQLLAANKKRAEKGKNKEKYAFEEVRSFQQFNEQSPGCSISDYLISIHSLMVNEENKKRADGKLVDDETGNFQKFIWQLFVKGFDNYLQNHSQFGFIANPQEQYEQGITKAQLAQQQNEKVKAILLKIKPLDGVCADKIRHLAFRIFCKMLDSRHLNELHNQFSKWLQASAKGVTNGITANVNELQEIISLCLLSADIVPNNYKKIYSDGDECLKTLAAYIDFDIHILKQQEGIFVQSDESPIIFAPIELSKKYAIENVMQAVISKNDQFKISSKEIKEWKKNTKSNDEFGPAALSEQRQKMHLEWANNKKSKDKSDKTINWLDIKDNKGEKNKEIYQSVCERLDKYTWQNNKIHLVHIRNLHNLLIEILGRLAKFVAYFDRDFQFIDKGASLYRDNDLFRFNSFINLKDLLDIKNSNNDQKDILSKVENVSERQAMTLEIMNQMTEQQKKDFWDCMDGKRKFYRNVLFNNNNETFSHRNYLAHFNFLSKSDYSLLDLIAHTRLLMSYDRKLKNAVTKSISYLLEQHGIEVKFNIDHEKQDAIEIKSIQSKKVKHLSGAVLTDQVNGQYVCMVKALFELKL